MDVAPVASDHQLPIGPVGVFENAGEERQSELFEDVIVRGAEIVIGQLAENGARFGHSLALSLTRSQFAVGSPVTPCILLTIARRA